MKFIRCVLAGVVPLMIGLGIVLEPELAMAQRPLGLDVSSYQGSADNPPTNINWPSAMSAGYTFAWAKATEGTGYYDADFVYNMTHARTAGVLIGAYHYCHPELHLGTNGADLEAAYFWNHIKSYITNGGYYLMPMLDFEQDVTSASPAYTKATLSAWVNEWCQDIVNYGASNGVTVLPVVYTYTSYSAGTSGNGPGVDSSVTNWPLWMASYPNHPNPQTGAPSSTAPWTNWNFWQYSSTTTVNGIENETDVDVFNGTAAMLGNYVIGGALPMISAQPSNVTILQSGTASFSVTASGGTPSYQWEFDGASIAGATNATLTISNVQAASAGNYEVIVSNVVGSVTSSNALLTVIPMISNVMVMPRPVSAIITWSTATNATGQVVYGTSTNYGAALPLVTNLTVQHGALLTGLQPATTYYFALISSNSPYAGTNAGSFSTDVTLIVESSQAAYSGVWTVASAAPDKYSPYYEYSDTSTGSDTAEAVFRPNVPTPALYDVYFWYSQGTNRSQSAPVTVGYLGGSVENYVDETTNGGSWQLQIAGAPFAAGANGYLRLGNGSGESGKVVIADAVKLVYSAGQDLPKNNTPPAWWANFYFGTNSVNGAALGSNGYSLLADYVIGLSPVDPNSLLNFSITSVSNGLQPTFSPYGGGRSYGLQSATAPTNPAWTTIPNLSPSPNTNGQGTFTVTNASGAQGFYRLSIQLLP